MEGNERNSCMGFYKDALDVKVVDSCNGRCAFCIEQGGRLSTCLVPVEDQIRNINNLNPKSVLLLGGEPFLYADLGKLIRGIEAGEVFITTNGSLLDSRTAKEIASNLTALNISVHHYSMEENRKVTGLLLDLQKLRDGIGVLREQGVSVRFNSLLTKGFLDDYQSCTKLVKLAKELGVTLVRFSEIQNDTVGAYVDASTIFDGMPNEPFIDGCEVPLSLGGVVCSVKVTCGFVNSRKAKISNASYGCHGGGGDGCHGRPNMGVLYPDGFHSPNWLLAN